MAALQRAARVPPEAVIATPSSAVDSVRASLLLSAVIPEMVAQTNALKDELAALRQVRSEISSRRVGLANAQQRLEREQQAVDRLIERKTRLRERLLTESEEEKRQLASLSASATDLRQLMDRLADRQRGAPLPADHLLSFSRAPGTLPLPARGRLIQRFGEENEAGVTLKGIVVETRPLAQVVAPFDGRVAFSGSFRRYGQLLIIAHGEGYHSLVAGVGTIDVGVGQWVLAGEPVGRMSQGDGPGPELYIEIRRNGEPINPQPWLAAADTKVGG
ncbi:MAG: hypothetical protein EXQ85_01825 [Alphaproteobacteria bacterium]|nr:hypothetical protein [Alphaproteobacteria bacterium]